ncbi:hypothetical protein F8M41_024709 [Gigaspora margarita]|uniref:Uncharacterized protein n=1 Tax=Gigaspora margarita TaxID=4874 RepID=A0A8H3XKI1_GIGMA|nr:hypothetical protein F8M41_024709 [Gigaspora margarita]
MICSGFYQREAPKRRRAPFGIVLIEHFGAIPCFVSSDLKLFFGAVLRCSSDNFLRRVWSCSLVGFLGIFCSLLLRRVWSCPMIIFFAGFEAIIWISSPAGFGAVLRYFFSPDLELFSVFSPSLELFSGNFRRVEDAVLGFFAGLELFYGGFFAGFGAVF